MIKLSLTVLVAALLVSAPVLVSGKEKAFFTVTVSPGSIASAHREDNAYYQPRLAREAYIKRQIEGRGTQSMFNPKEFNVTKSVTWNRTNDKVWDSPEYRDSDSDGDGGLVGIDNDRTPPTYTQGRTVTPAYIENIVNMRDYAYKLKMIGVRGGRDDGWVNALRISCTLDDSKYKCD